MSETESSEFEPYDCFDDFEADLERFTRSQPAETTENYDHQGMKYETTSQSTSLSRRNMGFMRGEEADNRGKIAIQIKPKRSTNGSGFQDRSEAKTLPRRGPSIEERLAKFTSATSSEAQVSSTTLKPTRSRKLSNPERGEFTSTSQTADHLFTKHRFRAAADTFKDLQGKDENANTIARKNSLDSEILSAASQSRLVTHKSHEIKPIDHTKDEMSRRSRNSDRTGETSVVICSPSRRPVMQQQDEQEKLSHRRKAGQAKIPSPTVIDYPEPQQALSRLGVSDRKNTAKQTQQWSGQEAEQGSHLQRNSNSLIREQQGSKTLPHHHITKPSGLKTFSTSAVNSNKITSVQSSKNRSLSNSCNSSKLQQFSAAISSSQREQTQQGPRGGNFYLTKLNSSLKSTDQNQSHILSPPSSAPLLRKAEAGSWISPSSQKSPTRSTLRSESSSPNVVSPRLEKNNNIVWITDSATGSSDEDRIVETDSSTTTSCSVIDERRRRRLVKRTKKRSQANRKSQLSQFIGREVSAIESQTSDDGASRASPSVNENIEDVISPDEDIEELSPKESYKRAKQIFEKEKPVLDSKPLLKTVPKVQKTGYEIATVDKIIKPVLTDTKTRESTPARSQSMSALHTSYISMSAMDLETTNLSDGLKRGKKNRNAFSAVAKVSKITIPSLQMRNFSPPGKYRHNSDTESYAGPSKILSDPFNLGRRGYRDNNLAFSDGEHELTARLEKNEEQDGDSSFDPSRRCYTLPRNLGKKKMKQNPFQLNLKGKMKGKDYLDIQSNSQSNIEDANLKVMSFLSMKDSVTNRIQSKSTGCIGIEGNKIQKDIIADDMSSADLQSGTESSSTLTDINVKTEMDFLFPVPQHKVDLNDSNEIISENDVLVEEVAIANHITELQSSDAYFPDVIAPPDSFRDQPAENNITANAEVEKEILEREINELSEELISTSSPLGDESFKSHKIANDTSAELERVRGRQILNSQQDEDHDRGESPRRRPSYLKAQFSSETLFWPEAGSQGVLSDESSNLASNLKMPATIMEDQAAVLSPSEEKDSLTGQKKKRARPRIPSSLEPIKSSAGDLIMPSKAETDKKSKDKPSLKDAKNDRVGSFQQIIKSESESPSPASPASPSLLEHKKPEVVKRRPRALLAAPPMLEEIPEEKSHGSGGETSISRTDNTAAAIAAKAKRGRKQGAVLQSPLLADEQLEPLDGQESPRTEKSDKSESGYFTRSQSSTPSQLMSSLDEIMPSDSPTSFGGIEFAAEQNNDPLKHDRLLDIFTQNAPDAIKSHSEPTSVAAAAVQPGLGREASSEALAPAKWTSSSDPNLPASVKPEAKQPKPQNAVQQQQQQKGKENKDTKDQRKGSSGSNESVRSPMGSPFEQQQQQQQHQRNDSQKSLSSTSSVPDSPIPRPHVAPDSPVGIITPKAKQKPDMRRHVLQNLLDTEKSYVQNMTFLVTVYYKPLKKAENASIIETSQVDEIFFQIPEILVNHEFFLEQLINRANCWTDKQIVGDIFVSSFTKCLLMDAYSSFINHYLQARATVRSSSLRPAFGKFLEQCCKEHREKLTLQDLMIQPVQRIPRYVLILKDMLKHTSPEHPDYGLLQLALEEIKTLAERMNKGEMEADQAEKEAEKLRDIEATIEGITDLVTSTRKFIRQDLVAEIKGVITKKDRCIFLFSDLLVCATVRRKNNALRRGSLVLFSGQSATEFNRYKLLWKLPLDTTELVKGGNSSTPKRVSGDKQIERIEEDIAILGKISSMTGTLVTPHQNLDMSIRDVIADLNRQLAEQTQVAPVQSMPASLGKVELQAQTEDGTENFVFVFLSTIIKSSWEACYEDAKQKLAYARHTFPPEFQYPLPIDKTRSGMQFTCAAPSRMANIGDAITDQSRGDVWVCNSDGYVGQVCLVSMVPEAQSRPCVTVCSARIQCISPVPGSKLISTNRPKTIDSRKMAGIHEGATRSKKSKSKNPAHLLMKSKKSLPSESDEDEATDRRQEIIAFDSPDEEDGDMGSTFIGGSVVFGGRMSPDGSSLGTVESVEALEGSSSDNQSYPSGNDTSDDEGAQPGDGRRISLPMGTAVRRGNHGYTLKGSLDDLLSEDNEEQPTMWLGTEDGCIHVYQSSDVSQVRKSKMKMQFGAVVNAILYQENKVFVALANGELIVYKRDPGNGWEVAYPETIRVGSNGASITCIAAAAGRIWCGCQNNIILINSSTLKIETTIQVSQDSHRSVYRIVSCDLGVWVSLQSSAVVRLYHATTYENLADIDVAPAVHKMLAGADAIIRQHKAACLRVTALLACNDLLWIGTSAGVILTNPLPTIKINTKSLRNAPGPTGSPHGHTGHVRFLTSVEVPKSQFKADKLLASESSGSNNRSLSPVPQRTGKNAVTATHKDDNTNTVTLVISGGDGYEDFRTNANSESVGREDSTNHLLIWRV
eukprot:gene7578-8417_t